MKIYEYLIDSPGRFIVIKRWIDKTGRLHMTEHFVSLSKGRWLCDCKGFKFSKPKYKNGKPKEKGCNHIKFIKAELRKPDCGILRYRSEFDCFEWERWFKDEIEKYGITLE